MTSDFPERNGPDLAASLQDVVEFVESTVPAWSRQPIGMSDGIPVLRAPRTDVDSPFERFVAEQEHFHRR